MLKLTLVTTAVLLALCGSSEAFDWRFSDAEISALKNTSDFLRFLGMPAEVSVIREPIAGGTVATSRWTYYFAVPPGIVRVDYYFAGDRLARRDAISADRSRRYRMIVPDRGRAAAAVFRYKQAHPR